MKYWLIAVVLANIILFLVEFTHDSSESADNQATQTDSQNEPLAETSDEGKQPESAALDEPRHEPAAEPQEEPLKIAESPKEAKPAIPAPAPKPGTDEPPSQAISIPLPAAPATPSDLESKSNADKAPVHENVMAKSAVPPAPPAAHHQPETKPETSKPAVEETVAPLEPVKQTVEKPAVAPERVKPAVEKQAAPSEPLKPAGETAKEIKDTETEAKAKTPEQPALPEIAKAIPPTPPAPAENTAAKTEKPASVAKPATAAEKPAAKKKAAAGETVNKPAESQASSKKPDLMKASCYRLGGVKNAAAISDIVAQYRPQLTELSLSSTGKAGNNKRNLYTVYYPALQSMEEAQSMAARMRSDYGVTDLQLLREGELKGAISLGVFSIEQNALNLRNKLEKQGLHVVIKPRYSSESAGESEYKIRMRWTEEQAQSAEKFLDAVSASAPDIERINACQ